MFKTYLDIMLLKGYPHDIPYSRLMPLIWIAINMAMLGVIGVVLDGNLIRDYTLESVDIIYTALALFGLLWYYKHRERFVQAFTAIMGVSVLFFLFLTGAVLIFRASMVVAIMAQLIYIWILVVFVHILRDALDVTAPKAILWVIGLEVLRFALLGQLLERLS